MFLQKYLRKHQFNILEKYNYQHKVKECSAQLGNHRMPVPKSSATKFTKQLAISLKRIMAWVRTNPPLMLVRLQGLLQQHG